MEQKRKRMEELVELLNRAARVYYQESNEIMSNQEYDLLYDELEALEAELGITLSNSPYGKCGLSGGQQPAEGESPKTHAFSG